MPARVSKQFAVVSGKYRNKPIVVDGVRFDSTREAVRFHTLRLLEKAGGITALKRQPRYPLLVGAEKIGEYRADMEYQDATTGEVVTEDVKSDATEKITLFRWKKKHFEAQYGRKIRVTK